MRWRTWLKPVVMIIYCILICTVLPFIIIEYNNKHASTRKEAWLIGGIFTLGSVPISLWTIIEHVIHYTKPYLQRHIIRVLWMVPIYALNAWFAIGFRAQSIYFDTLRECYEAYVIYNFMAFLLNFLTHEYPDFGYMIEQKPQAKHLIPCCCLPKCAIGMKFINTCRHGVLQYTIVRPLTTMVAFACEMAGVYHPNQFRLDGAYLYLTIVNNISQVCAMYSLIMFFRCTRTELKPLKPISKFICVKFVVFLSFWQSILFSILTATKVISNIEAWKLYKPEEISSIFQNFCICIEMFLAAIAHHFSFSVAPYRPEGNDETPQCCYSCLAMCDLSDVKKDMVEHVKHVGRGVRATLTPTSSSNAIKSKFSTEETPLIAKNPSDCDLYDQCDPVARSTYHTGNYRSQRHLIERLESTDSIGSGSSLRDDVIDSKVWRSKVPSDSRSSLNNHFLMSHSSVSSLWPVSEVTHESNSVDPGNRATRQNPADEDKVQRIV